MKSFVGLIFELFGFAALIVMACMALFAVGEHIEAPSLLRDLGLVLVTGCIAAVGAIGLVLHAFFRARKLIRRKDS